MVAAGMLNVSLTDYAIGGATSGAVPGYLEVPASFSNQSTPTAVEVPSSLEQVSYLHNSAQRLNCAVLYSCKAANLEASMAEQQLLHHLSAFSMCSMTHMLCMAKEVPSCIACNHPT